jgi:hypothetical protein
MQKLIKDKKKSREAFNLTPSYIDDVLPINNTNFANWIPLIEIVSFLPLANARGKTW